MKEMSNRPPTAIDSSVAYAQIAKTIDLLSKEDPDESFWIDVETARCAMALCEMLQKSHIEPPQIFPHGGDGLDFVWNHNGGRRYVTSRGESIRVRDYSADGCFIEERTMPFGQEAMTFLRNSR